MQTTETKRTNSWDDTPFGQLYVRSGQRRPQPSVGEVLARLLAR